MIITFLKNIVRQLLKKHFKGDKISFKMRHIKLICDHLLKNYICLKLANNIEISVYLNSNLRVNKFYFLFCYFNISKAEDIRF